MNSDYEVKKILCHNGMGGCWIHCGLLAYIDKKTGKIIKIEGNPNHPLNQGWVCHDRSIVNNWAGKWLYHPDQLMYPLKRVGERGKGKWQRISWDQALDEIAAKLKELKEKYGPECLATLEGTYRSDQYPIRARFLFAWGNPYNEAACGSICLHPGAATELTMTGGFSFGSEPSLTRLLIVPAGNLPEMSPPNWRRFAANRKNLKVIVIDPRFSENARNADYWLQIRPGTDCALFMAWAKIIIEEELYDKEFVENWTNAPFLVRTDKRKLLRECDVISDGSRENFVVWDKKRENIAIWKSRDFEYQPKDASPALRGIYKVKLMDGTEVECKTVWEMLIERLSPYMPECVEEITWISSEKIIETARLFGKYRPVYIFPGVGLYQAGKNTSDNHIMKTILQMISGSYDVNGGVRLGRFRPGPVIGGKIGIRDSMLEGQEFIKPETKKKMLGAERFKVMAWPAFDLVNEQYKRVWGIPQTFCDHTYNVSVGLIWRAILTGKPYPIKALITFGSNPVMWAPNTKLVYKALKSLNLELHVVLEHWMTPTADLADYVLPVASKSLEVPYLSTFEDLTEAFWVGENAVEPLGERHSDYDFWRGLAERLGLSELFPWKNAKELIEYRLASVGLSFDEAVELGLIVSSTPGYMPWEDKVYAQIDPKTGKPRGFATVSGRAEIWSTILEELGYDPLPQYEEPYESPLRTPELAKEYPLILTTGGRFRPMFHSENRHWGIGFREQYPWPICDIHHETARELGISNGDWVWIETRRGRILQRARVGPHQHPRVVNVESSWWYPELPSEEPWLHGAFISNANVLTEDDPDTCDEKLGSWYLRAYLCKVYKAKPEELKEVLGPFYTHFIS
ncbi:MAG: molybdopterin-dependent oxidoreductase [Candidatus Bathyarchaeia archaeon]